MSDNQQNELHPMRHSLAHIMAAAVTTIWPEAKLGVGPVVENGFYYDVDIPDVAISEDDFKKIEKAMYKVINKDESFVQSNKPIVEALQWAKDAKQPYKEELLNDLKRAGTTVAKDLSAEEMGTLTDAEGSKLDEVGFYTNGDFTDLCRGPHVESTGKVGAFKLMRVAGAYWRGNEKNPQMQRLYGVAFETKEELKEYLQMLEEAKKRDHRKLGKELDLFFISEDVGAGLPLMMPKGETIKDLLMRYMRQEEKTRGYQYVSTPVLTQEKLYERSGHAQFYAEDMYSTAEDEEGNKFYLKPMNCPHNHMIYERMVESYKDLPLRLSEHAGLYRYELSGTLTGLIRMRGPITQNDSHVYVTNDQLRDELKDLMEFFAEVYATFDFKDYWYRVSLPDFSKDKYGGDEKAWRHAAKVITDVLDEIGAEYVTEEGEAAFYGPKIDVQTRNVLGKEDSIATMQIDILVPSEARMNLVYKNADNQDEHPIIIHKSIMGAFERFMGFLLEQTAGHFPFWLAPEQVRILTINDSVLDYVSEVKEVLSGIVLMKPLKYNELRYELDDRSESLGKKIREASKQKVPLMLIIGERDKQDRTVSVRTSEGESTIKLEELQDFVQSL